MPPDAYLALRAGATVIEADSFGEKVLLLVDGSMLKLFRRKRLLSSAAWYPYAERFADNASALRQRGIPVPEVIDVFRIPSIGRDAVHYHPLPGRTLRQLRREGLEPSREARLKDAFTHLLVELHEKGVYFRSLHLGNVVCTPDGRLGLIDIADARMSRRPLRRHQRIRNLQRLLKTADESEWVDEKAILERRPKT
ncbi:MAG TPA: toluene tolerance protein [Accumulibacter sp.]|uniref:toluene tolerance protein n=1 Tax=Accumulibacter sp. TaxID=2053492 RepID=UPI002BD34784|nr:toluene tolerance protein [Accumulibacter sp.]HMV03966.1 toluene tolerance protein [Accumulibacter sp.]HMW80147.1 toluene tolerance protein [Accumulibacter sp.]HNB67307.1 toluene tolerance protein [Accumulibacter sp.]HNC27790.1 toluene tolerance protein [Accumulibacter sp.]HNE40903.1 toluene tolerance protein [Accumulibacter sp.]